VIDEALSVLRLDGPIEIAQSDTDPGDMGEPRVFESDGVTYVTVPSFTFWGLPAATALETLTAMLDHHYDKGHVPREAFEDCALEMLRWNETGA
jgi:hypothetical protein